MTAICKSLSEAVGEPSNYSDSMTDVATNAPPILPKLDTNGTLSERPTGPPLAVATLTVCWRIAT